MKVKKPKKVFSFKADEDMVVAAKKKLKKEKVKTTLSHKIETMLYDYLSI